MRLFWLFCLIPILFSLQTFGQGCSDAGFCTMGAMRPNQHYSKKADFKLRTMEVGQYIGYTKFHDYIIAYWVDANFSIGKKMSAQIKLPIQGTIGPLGNTFGIGDISLSATRMLKQWDKWQLSATIGGKVPTGVPQKTDPEGRILPMYYQTTLGTYDFITGVSLINRNWLFAAGYQLPFNKVNNDFFWGPWRGTDLFETAQHYPTSKELNRGMDVMFRVERNFRASKFNIHVGLLPIWRLNEDERIDPLTGDVESVAGSDGLALSGLLGGGYHLNTRSNIKVLFGARIIQRDVNPDGLSREFVNTISYEFRF
jgi:hypothetical protein